MYINTAILLVQYYTNLDFPFKFLLESVNQSKNELISIMKFIFRYSLVVQLFANSHEFYAGREFPSLQEPPIDDKIMKKRENYTKIAITAPLSGQTFSN